MTQLLEACVSLSISNESLVHPEKCFVESTKIWLAQQSFLFKHGPMEILFELAKKILLTFFEIPTKKFCIDRKKKIELLIKITKLL